MALGESEIRILRETLPLVRKKLMPASTSFYETLFELAPELRGLFRSDLTGQGMRFMTTLATIVDLMEDPAGFSAGIDDLAQAHMGIGVRAAYFVPMRLALMVTMGETLGPGFTPEVRAAWGAAYDYFSAEMIARGGLA